MDTVKSEQEVITVSDTGESEDDSAPRQKKPKYSKTTLTRQVVVSLLLYSKELCKWYQE